MGSAAHPQTRRYLLAELAELGCRAEVNQSVGVTDPGQPGPVPLGAVANVVATLAGTDPSGTVVLAAHYDTVAGSPGAADDGIGVATVLETARALSATGATPPRNDVLALITDGEEAGLLGAAAFVRDQAASLGPTVVLNHEARGARGIPTAFRTTHPNERLLSAMAAAPGAVAESFAEAAFGLLPNNTDHTNFAGAGLHGIDTAITGGGATYHSPEDNLAHLSSASLQQMGGDDPCGEPGASHRRSEDHSAGR
jgi:Zn-dependent M28 family amino/carboxypeptidase